MLVSLGNFVESSSPFTILVATSLLVLMTIELGFRLGVKRSRSTKIESDALLSAMTGAHLALLAFIMAFSFSQAANHYSNRNELVLKEADAIAEGYRHAGMLGEDQKFILQELIHSYLAVRLTIT